MNFNGLDILPIASPSHPTTGKFPLSVLNGAAGAVSWSPAFDQDEYAVIFETADGLYDITVGRIKGPTAAIAELWINGVLVDTTDLYAAAISALDTLTLAGVTLVNGTNVLLFKANGKNGASTNYLLPIATITVTPS